MTAAAALALLMALSADDLARLEPYEAAFAEPQPPPALVERARAEFGGRGPELARYFLLHTSPPPRPGAVFFVLRVVGDAETALVLIDALAAPPPRQSGILDRDPGEVAVAAEMVLENEDARLEPRVVPAILAALEAARRPHGPDERVATSAVRLLGQCRSVPALRALQGLLSDDNQAIRVAAAAALGAMGRTVPEAVPAAGSPVVSLARTLREDAGPEARAQAADSLAMLATDEAVAALRAAVETEAHPRVIDAVLSALHRVGAPLGDPRLCRVVMERAGEAAPIAFACWRAAASPRDVVSAALNGPPQVRAMALHALIGPATARTEPRHRIMLERQVPPPVRFPPDLRERLLDSAVFVLSRDPRELPHSVLSLAYAALWEIAGREMALALKHADRVRPVGARFAASEALSRQDAEAYAAARRPRQTGVALTGAVAALLLAVAPPLRRSGIVLAVASATWAAFVYLGPDAVRSLPPPPLWLLTVAAIGCLAAGLSAAMMALIPRRDAGWRSWLPPAATPFMAAGLALLVCGWTRGARVFPGGGEGWELLFEPLAAALLAGASGLALAAADRLVLAKVWPGPESAGGAHSRVR